jgi:enoyl-CoA hydratase
MASFVLTARRGAVAVITLNRPDVLNAWHAPMRDELVAALTACDADPEIRAVVLTGAGDRAFSAGQDLNEAKDFDPDRAEAWIREWERLYDRLRTLSKPVIAALNGVAAGSAFQVALLCDFRIGHPGVRMGQPEIDAGIASTTGPWIMREMLGLARTIDLTLTGRLMDAAECLSVGLITRVVAPDEVLPAAMTLAGELATKPPVAMRLNRRRFREMTQDGFLDCLEAGIRTQRESFASHEPAEMMERFLAKRAGKRP